VLSWRAYELRRAHKSFGGKWDRKRPLGRRRCVKVKVKVNVEVKVEAEVEVEVKVKVKVEVNVKVIL